MKTKELRELDALVAELMEPRPESVTLRSVRGKNDDRYNHAEQSSNGGWWKCATGADAENRHIGDLTLCKWEPLPIASEQSIESTAAALEVLKKCQDKTKTANIFLFRSVSGNHPCIGLEGDDDDGLMVEAETLELAICLFAKKLFSK